MSRSLLPALGIAGLGIALIPLLLGAADGPEHDRVWTPGKWRSAEAPALKLASVRARVAQPERAADPELLRPAPTEHWLADGAEQINKTHRKAWFKEMHRAAPGVDTAAVEHNNGLDQVRKRNLLALAPPPPVDEWGGQWTERGSDNQAGRMMVARNSPDGTTLYAGSSKGGVWKGDPDGGGWTPIGDNLYGGAAWLEVLSPASETDPPVLVAATDGGLIHTSTDEGATWNAPADLDGNRGIRRLLMGTDGDELLYAVVRFGDEYRVMRSENQGQNWDTVLDLGDFPGDIWVPRDGGGALYAATSEALVRSDDQGDNWTTVGAMDAASRVELAGSEAGAPRFYAVLDGNTLFRSDDAGANWTEQYAVSDYWGALNASIVDADLFAWGGVHVSVTRDGGDSFSEVNKWWDYYDRPHDTLHADIMGIDVFPEGDGERWFINTDGGLYRSDDGMDNVENLGLSGLRVSQYYTTHTSTANPEHVAAGAQDQGYQITNDTVQDDGVYEFDQILSGDYGHLTSGDGTHEYVYSVYPGFILVQVGEDNPWLAYLDFPPNESYVPWLPPVVGDPEDNSAFFFAASKIYKYVRNGESWDMAVWSESGLELNSGEYVSALRFSPVNSDRAYAATSEGKVFWSDDHGLNWIRSANRVADDNWYYGQAIVGSKLDVDTVYIGGSGYSVPGVYKSTDGGQTFEPWSDGLPDTLVYSLAESGDAEGCIFAGTETGVWARHPLGEEWLDMGADDAPVTTYWSAETLAHENTIRFGTYGRGIWDYQLDPEGTGAACQLPIEEPPDTGDGGDGGDGADGGDGGDGADGGDGGDGADGGDGGSGSGGGGSGGVTQPKEEKGCATVSAPAALGLLCLAPVVARRRSERS